MGNTTSLDGARQAANTTSGNLDTSSDNYLPDENPDAGTLPKVKRPFRPKHLHVHPLRIPQELRDIAAWVCWTYWFDKRRNSWTKCPIKASQGERQGRFCDVTNEENWGTFQEAIEYLTKNRSRCTGVGFCLRDHQGLASIDLDHCVDRQTGVIAPWAMAIVESSPDAYWERSPSGTGLRCWGYGNVDGEKGIRQGHVEVYSNVKYLTATGHSLIRNKNAKLTNIQGTIDQIQEEFQKYGKTACGQAGERIPVCPPTFSEDVGVANLPAEFSLFGHKHNRPEGSIDSSSSAFSPSSSSSSSSSVGMFVPSDLDIIERASRAADGDVFMDLWNGGGSPNRSSADLALCNRLAFWCGNDPERMESLMRQSGLYRDKWDDHKTYLRKTIAKALAKQTVFYDWEAAARRQAEKEQQAAEREAKRQADARRDYEVKVEAKQQREHRTSARDAANNAAFSCSANLYALMESRGLATFYGDLPRAAGCGFSRHLRGRADHTRRINGRLCCRGWSKCPYCRARNTLQRAEHFAGIFDKHDRAKLPLTLWCGSASQLESIKKRIKRADGEYVAILQPGSKFIVITNADATCLDGVKCSEMRTLPRGGGIVAFIDAAADIPEYLDKRARPIRASKFWQYGADREPSKYEVDPVSDQLAVQFTPEQFTDLLRRSGIKVETKGEVSDGFDRADYYCLPEYAWNNFVTYIQTFEEPCPPDILWRKPDDPGGCPFSSLFRRARGGSRQDKNGQYAAATAGDGAATPAPRRSNWVDPSPN